ncbi:MAG: fumarylacetoacetate hydrolase family protein [Rhodocyclaceae bacterium]|jgi:2-keto-4-pentenoate hydratase/2-oxohepta-3-ene-1,7-dioic acid hydratase in catechol pathway|nr:fumarylacetoacetate hydrolase family protein [Rhodocyclaceae bacterium]MCA3017895.1 fumarylacetoacetate hydrolase family protein [Rhodocyclaceae bacterium]MCA3022559.1 fumarylacetoacetate hydrolase family protein [Rhodocyclaceae bacterium]MCA3024950.1 fumarylacetoacetate hydrolase family protein [Rhodocyclaceae bacterium]MCA3028862.1 fumarylacetoacetate hydrolase family protein [Rhodocyclaceae bacterium]
MKLVTFQMLGTHELRTGIWLSKYEVIDVAAEAAARQSPLNLTTMLDIIDGGAATLALLAEISSAPKTTPILLNSALLKAPIPRPRKNVFCVGWNYLDHFSEGAASMQDSRELPHWPVFFSKAPTAVTGPYDAIPFDANVSTQLDWEVELGVVLGKAGKNIAEADAMSHVFGYTVINDVTWRDIQRRHGGQWDKGKSLDGTCPMGPCIVTADALDPADLRVECRVSNVVKQQSSTKHLFFKIPRLIHDLSLGQTLEPGDVISTGTPEGVGFARKPPEWMRPGDLLETEIQGIGVMRNPIGEM